MILENQTMIDYSEAVAMTYLEIYTLDRPSLDAVCRQFPACGAKIRKAARRMLIQRVVIKGMREQAGLPPPKSFILPAGQTHALPPTSLEQKVDILIDSSNVAKHKLSIIEGHELEYDDIDDVGGDEGPLEVAVPSDRAASSSESSPPKPPSPPAPLSSPTLSTTSPGSIPPSQQEESDRSVRSQRSAVADQESAASFERLLAMYQDVSSLQAAMGEELAKLAGSLGKQSRSTRLALPRQPGSNRGGNPKSAPGALRQIKEEDNDDDQPWMSSARKFLPPWAQPGGSDAMSA